jgi:lipopolysaccharide export system permease protein
MPFSMGKTLRSYVVREILGAFVGGLVLFTFVLFLTRILELVNLVMARGIPADLVARLFAYVLPSFLELTIPMATLLGVVVAFARFSSDGELLAMRAAGVSLWQLARPALAMGTMAGVATLLMAQWGSPWAQRRITETTYEIAKTRATAALRPRMFNALADGLVVYADRIESEPQRLEGVLVSDERDEARRMTVLARSAHMETDEPSKVVYLRLGSGTSVTYHAARDSYDTTSFGSLEVRLDLGGKSGVLAAAGERPLEQMYLGELASDPARGTSKERAIAATLELHRRFALAAAGVLLALLGLPLGAQPSHAHRARGLSVSIVVVLAYHVLFTAAAGLARHRTLDPVLAMWLPDLVVAAVAAFMIGRAAADRAPYPSTAALADALLPARRLAAS